ncbi:MULTISPECIES: hypothetical protein [unclassified Leptolyngbya]|uniref:hypothetical protein n=1 Tax=unclassified Leptolyngbya TaxID=2650499 RepID=UPI001684DB70|nr:MULTISPECIES: hypothetical protein [unclassified Leptolyngbya]MBD1910712.1 hypothetical protein [Leptolyngbya sp. FACHB-8]MBD2154309.1 hypothetical protein [Leptolyngbya sp. FACHB-16]
MRFLFLLVVIAAGGWLVYGAISRSNASANNITPDPGITPAPSEQRPNRPTSRRYPPEDVRDYESYHRVIEQTVNMVRDPEAQALANRYGLDILNVTWEDTGRYQNSAVGPNISDMTIQVQQRHPIRDDYALHLMPVIRYPNFTDQSADIDIDQFFLPLGNQRGEDLQPVPLREVLDNLRDYLTEPDSWAGRGRSLLADRDTHVLVSAQACFLPIPQQGMAEFNPVLFNYQSYPGDPAVLTLLVTRQGTSVTVIDNQRDGFEAGRTWGQRLFFNKNGDRASLTGQRLSDYQAENPNGEPSQASAAGEEGLNMVMLIQVPLRQRQPANFGLEDADITMVSPPSAAMGSAARGPSNVEEAVIGHGAVEGPFTEIAGLPIERDDRFPIRVTVQFYKATSNGVVSEKDIQQIRQQIARVYDDADYVGSLVVDGLRGRPTEYDGPHEEPEGWWEDFWQHYRDRIK